MEISIKQANQLKSIAILMMLCLHLFNRSYKGLFEPLLFVGKQPVIYYISLLCDACVPIFAFTSGYGLYYKYRQDKNVFFKNNFLRLKKLYVNYWIIILIFPILIGLTLQYPDYPGSWSKILKNSLGVDPTYNGAWWFFTIYILFVLTAKICFSILDKINPIIYLGILFILYLTGFYFRVYRTNIFDDSVMSWIHKYAALYFCTLFQFLLGAFALKYKWNSFIYRNFQNIKCKNSIIFLLLILLAVIHILIPNLIVAPFTGLGFILLYCQLQLSDGIKKGIDFFTPHSTNIWLIHMFFYMIFFPDFVYSFRYPIIIFSFLVLICVACSYIINFINFNIQKIIS